MRILSLGLLITLLISCSSRLVNIQNFEGNSIPKDLTTKQIKSSFYEAAITKGWTLEDVKKGELIAKINVRDHYLELAINYTKDNYNMMYKDSKNLMYNSQSLMIHRSYRKWAINLKREIDKSLMRESFRK